MTASESMARESWDRDMRGDDVPVRVGNLCGHCQEEGGAVPEECPACYGFGYVEPMRIGLTGHASPRYDHQRCAECDGSGKVAR